MKKLNLTLPLLFVSLTSTVFAQPAQESRQIDPFGCLEVRKDSPQALRDDIKERLENLKPLDAFSNCVIAEMMKRVGDSRAAEYYERAIRADESEPAFDLFLGDYYRNFRGPQRPLFPQAEKHYYAARRKLQQLSEHKSWDETTENRLERALVSLNQEDGLPLLDWTSDSVERPYLFFSSVYRTARLTTDTEAVDDIRAFTSEALFAASGQRLNRPLTLVELRGIARAKDQFETFDRVRFRYKEMPVIDVFYKHRKIEDAQVTNFFAPNIFNDFRLNEYGVALEKPFSVSHYDVFLRGSYERTVRKGLIEFLPQNKERVNNFEIRGAVSRFVGPDKVLIESTYVFQDINPDVVNPPRRDRQIVAGTFTYQVFRPLPFLQNVYGQHFQTRGLHLFGGYANDRERFGSVTITKEDFFGGASLRGLQRFDLTIQPTWFRARVSGDPGQSSLQYRTNFNLLYRIVDEEREPGIPKSWIGLHPAFVHLVIPFKHDVGINGLKEFANYNLGAAVDAKFFTTGSHRTTFLASFRFSHGRFYKLDKNLNLFNFSVGMGF